MMLLIFCIGIIFSGDKRIIRLEHTEIREVFYMKKILSVLLALICLFSAMSVVAYADQVDLKDVISDEIGIEIKGEKAYGVVFQQGNAQVMYRVPTQVNLDGPGYLKLTNDEPIGVGKNFRCWKDENGNDVFAGQEILVDRVVYLTADWSVSTTHITALDYIICALKAMIHSLQVAIKVINTANEFRPLPAPVVTEEEE